MRHLILLWLLGGWYLQLSAQSCIRVVDMENFAASQAFTQAGAGNVNISSGAGRWFDAACGVYDRLYRPLNDTLSDSYFRIAFDFTVLPNAVNFGVGANLIAVTAGTLDFLSYDASLNYALTPQDGLGVILYSANIHDNNINNWQVMLQAKDDTGRTAGANTIFLNSQISNYYLVFERTSPTMVTLMLYTDSTQTTLLGQVQNSVSAGISDLSVLQFGVTTFGWSSRHFNGSIDNITFCDDVTTGLDEFNSQFPLSITENLADEHSIIVNSGYPYMITMMVMDITGGIVHKQEISSGANQIPADWMPGLYLMQFINNDKTVFAKKMVIK